MVLKQNQCILESGYQIQENATKRKKAFLNALNELVETKRIHPIKKDVVVIKHHRSIVELEYTVKPTEEMFTYLDQVYELTLLQQNETENAQTKLI